MPEPLDESEAAPQLTFLRRLVTVLTATMILGVLLIVTLLVIRLNTAPAPLSLPEGLILPDATTPEAITLTATRILIVDDAETLHVYNRATGDLLQSTPLP